MEINIGKLYKYERRQIANMLFVSSIFVAFFGSMNVWFMVPIHSYYPIIAFLLGTASYLLSKTSCHPIFTESYFLLPTIAFALLGFYQNMVNSLNINAYIGTIFNALMMLFIFRYDRKLLKYISTILSKMLGGLLIISYPYFLLYIIGFPLPNVNMVFNDGFYSFSNYFLVSDKQHSWFLRASSCTPTSFWRKFSTQKIPATRYNSSLQRFVCYQLSERTIFLCKDTFFPRKSFIQSSFYRCNLFYVTFIIWYKIHTFSSPDMQKGIVSQIFWNTTPFFTTQSYPKKLYLSASKAPM